MSANKKHKSSDTVVQEVLNDVDTVASNCAGAGLLLSSPILLAELAPHEPACCNCTTA